MSMLNPYLGTLAPTGNPILAIPNLELYVEADSFSTPRTNGTSISNWVDLSGNARDLVPVSGHEPAYWNSQKNGLPAILFQGGGSTRCTVPNFMTGFSAADVFFLYKLDLNIGNSMHNWSANGDAYAPFTDGQFYEDFGSTTRRDNKTPPLDQSDFRLYQVSSAAGSYQMRQNGVSMFSSASNIVGFSASPKLGVSNAQSSSMYLLACALFSRVITLAERNIIRDFYNPKYAIAIS